jgi:hypothetical protein
MNYHLILGYGEWSKKNLKYLKNRKFFAEIIIKTRNKYFFHSNKRVIKNIKKNEFINKIKSVHICTPLNNHFFHLKKFNHFEKTIIEKPFLKKISQLTSIKKLYKNKYFLVNYIDTFSPLIDKIKKSLNKKNFNQIILNYSKKNKFYRNKNEFALEWLDHPLSLILLFFKKFPEMKIEKKQLRKKNNLYNQEIIINYYFKNFNLKIRLNCSIKVERNFQILNNKNIETFHFYKNSIYKNNKKIFQSKKNSFDNFYNLLTKKQKNSTQNFDFHKKIILERNKILNQLKN